MELLQFWSNLDDKMVNIYKIDRNIVILLFF